MQKLKLLLFLLFVFANATAQKAFVASGGNATGSGGTSSYSIGQFDYTTATGSGGSAMQGVQIPFEIETLSGKEFTQIALKTAIYPNPTTDFVILKFENFDYQNLSYQLIDLNGREIVHQKITNSKAQIQVENLPNAIYTLIVNDKNRTIKIQESEEELSEDI